MEALIRFSLKQRVLYNLMFVLLTVVGFFALYAMPAERYPNVNFGEVIISTYFPGASPEEVESLVTRKIEDALETVEETEWVKSTSYRQRSLVRIKFIDDSDYKRLYDEVRFKVLNSIAELPAEVDPPVFKSIQVKDYIPVIVLNLVGDHDNRALALMAREIKTALGNLANVQEVVLNGEYQREFHISLDPVKMKAQGISFEQAVNALQAANVSIPAGNFSNATGEFLVKVDEKFRSREQVVSSIVRRDADGSFVRIADIISAAGTGYRDPLAISSVNGQDSVALQVIKADQGNALRIKSAVLELMEEYRPVLEREGVELIYTQDSTVYIEDGLSTLGLNMLVGITLVSLLIWYFMGFRNAGLVTIGIPFSFMITMLVMYFTGNSLNELTLFSFVLVSGIIVDDAIVVNENIYRHIQNGEPLQQAIITGTAEVALPVIAATMTTVAAFLPMLIMSGTTGEFFAQIPKAVSYAIIASLIECLLILPVHYLDFGPRPGPAGKAVLEKDVWLMKVLRRVSNYLLSLAMRFRITTVFSVALAFIAVIGIIVVSVTGRYPLIPIKFFPDDYNIYYVDVVGPASTPIEDIDLYLKDLSRFIQAQGPGYAASSTAFAGFYFNEDYEQVFANNHGTVMVTLPAESDRAFADPLAYLEQVRSQVTEKFALHGYHLHVHPQRDGPRTGKDINVRVVGSDFESITGLSKNLMAYIKDNQSIAPHLVDLGDDLGDDLGKAKRVYRFEVQHDRAQEYGIESSRVARLAGSVLDGFYIGKYRLTDEEVDLKVYIDPNYLQDPNDALYIPLIEAAVGSVHLGDVTQVRSYLESGELHRFQGQRAVSIQANLRAGAPTSTQVIVKTIRDYYQTIRDQYPGATVTFGGEHESTQRSYTSLAYAFLIAVLIMYVILATQFQSYLQPMIILSAIIFALIGVVFGKMLSQSLFTVNSFIAVIGVAGVVVNDALVLIDFINKRYRAGLSRREAIEEGVRIRLRPIVLTTLTTTLGLLPMALGIPSYSPVWGTMASTFVSGLATATALTIIVVPVLWDLVQGWQERREARRKPQLE